MSAEVIGVSHRVIHEVLQVGSHLDTTQLKSSIHVRR
jgi:hypothetical protein